MFPYLFALRVLSVVILFKIAWSYDSRRSRTNWLYTEGVVYICRVGTKHDSNGEEFYKPQIKRLYKVKGAPYTMTLENIDSWKSTHRKWENISRYYPGGFTLSICYDHKNHRHVFVKPLETSVA